MMLLDLYPASEEWPDGYALNICDGLMRLRYREGMDRPQLMEPGRTYEVTFNLYPTSNRFVAGHRLQVLVGASSFPRFDVNPNTGEPIGRETHRQVARNTIHHSATYPSRVTLPVVDS
jgi:putative CocE/NonD family hydrolase